MRNIKICQTLLQYHEGCFWYTSANADETFRGSSVRISLAKHKDAPTLARVMLLAFQTDKWEPTICPNQVGLTTTELLGQCGPAETRKPQHDLVGKNIYMTASVCTKDGVGDNKESIVGWARWCDPSGSRRLSLWEWLWSEVIYPLHQFLFLPAIASGLPKRIKEKSRSQHIETFGSRGVWEGRKHWYLHVLCVEPRWQGLGIGGALLEWSLDRAKEGNSAIYLESS